MAQPRENGDWISRVIETLLDIGSILEKAVEIRTETGMLWWWRDLVEPYDVLDFAVTARDCRWSSGGW